MKLGENIFKLRKKNSKEEKESENKIIDILKEFGGIIMDVENGYFVKKGDLKGIC